MLFDEGIGFVYDVTWKPFQNLGDKNSILLWFYDILAKLLHARVKVVGQIRQIGWSKLFPPQKMIKKAKTSQVK